MEKLLNPSAWSDERCSS